MIRGLFGMIRFTSGSRAGKVYFYKGKNLFCRPFWRPAEIPPLSFADFKEVQIISGGMYSGYAALTKCSLTNGEEVIALIESALLEILITYLHESQDQSGSTPPPPLPE